MSSHHFVKEDQEPALLILDPEAIPFETVQELLEWSPLVIVSNTVIERVLSWGIKIDVLVRSDAHQEFNQIVLDQMPIQIIQYTEGQAELESTIQFLLDRKQHNLNVIGIDLQNNSSIEFFSSEIINIVLFNEKCKWHFVGDGFYSKWLPGKSILKIFFDNQIEEVVVQETGIFKIERTTSFWVGEEY